MNDSILKRLAKIEENAIDIDKLEARMGRMEAQIQSMGMVAAPEIPEDVREQAARSSETFHEHISTLKEELSELSGQVSPNLKVEFDGRSLSLTAFDMSKLIHFSVYGTEERAITLDDKTLLTIGPGDAALIVMSTYLIDYGHSEA